MVGRLVLIAVVLVLAFAAAQLIQPARTNPPTDPKGSIAATLGDTSPATIVIERSCGDCHSNKTVWGRYTTIAPLSWVIVQGVAEGRRALNFSTWATYPTERRRSLLALSCQEASSRKMPPGVFMLLRPDAQLSVQDISALCAAASPRG